MHDSSTLTAAPESTLERTVPVWDPLVRFSHWTVLTGFFVAYFTEDDFMTAHVWAGYTVATLLVLRVLWGFIGSGHARFSDFVRSPAETLAYVRELKSGQARRYIGHNPAGAAMILALLLSLFGTSMAGFMLYAIEEDAGPLASWVADATATDFDWPAVIATARADDDEDDEDHRAGRGESAEHEDREEFWEEIHEFFANFTLLLIGFHVFGVLYSSYLHNENLPLAMFTGRKRAED